LVEKNLELRKKQLVQALEHCGDTSMFHLDSSGCVAKRFNEMFGAFKVFGIKANLLSVICKYIMYRIQLLEIQQRQETINSIWHNATVGNSSLSSNNEIQKVAKRKQYFLLTMAGQDKITLRVGKLTILGSAGNK
jgi:hypothetical protein